MERLDSLVYLRKQTVEFINQDPTLIELTSRVASRGPGGGVFYTPSGASRGPQVVKLIHQGGSGVSKGEGSEDRSYEYVILLRHDGDVAIGDSFFIGENKFIVYSLDPDNGYEVKAYARQHGDRPTDG